VLAFTGGVGIADQWMGHAQDEDHWRDIHFRVEGPVVLQVQAAAQTPEDRWDALVGCLWGLVALETRAQTGRAPEERSPILSADELRVLLRGTLALETAVAQARAALNRRGLGEGAAAAVLQEDGHDSDAGSLAEIRAELARRVAEAHHPGDDAGLAFRDAGAAPVGADP